MRVTLKDFQEEAVGELLLRLKQAKVGIEMGLPQAVVLSSPTGSGKTVVLTALIEEILTGSDRAPAEPDSIFLWVSDRPELNAQSRKRIESFGSVLRTGDLTIVGSDFDQEYFTGGKVYFLNVQKLGKDKLLTSGHGDKRTFTIWQTISNTAVKHKGRFYLIIDEAHRGTRVPPQPTRQLREP
jgi:type III restriction enzyme